MCRCIVHVDECIRVVSAANLLDLGANKLVVQQGDVADRLCLLKRLLRTIFTRESKHREERGAPLVIRRYCSAISSLFSVNMIADKRRHAAYIITSMSTSMTLNGGFSEFFAISGCETHFKSELRRNS